MRTFISVLTAELLKTKRTFAIWLSVIGASLIIVLWFCILFFKAKEFIPVVNKEPWEYLINECFGGVGVLLLPLYVVMLNSLILQIEHRHSGWKHVYAMPVKRSYIFFAKFVIILFLLILTHILFAVEISLCGWLLALLKPGYLFLKVSLPLHYLLKMTLKIFLSVLGICAIHYWLSYRLKNFVIPMGIGLAGTVTALTIYKWQKSVYIPYAMPLWNLTGRGKQFSFQAWHINEALVWSLIVFVLALSLSYLDIKRMEVK